MTELGILEQIEIMTDILAKADSSVALVSFEMPIELWKVILKAAESHFKNKE